MAGAARDHIFISYRRDDARGASGRLYDWLRIAFGRERVFLDVHSTGVGKWRDKIDTALAHSAVCIAVIGPRWANAENLLRLHEDGDMVRHELVRALAARELTIVPTLVEGADVPLASSLPTELRPVFGDWNARRVTEDGWEDDVRRVIAEIAGAAQLVTKPDLDSLLRDAGAAQQRVIELEETRHLQADQIEGLRRTIDELRRKLAEAPADERSQVAEAFAALARGDSRAAEDAFEREFEIQSQEALEARAAAAEAARNVANLALMRDVAKAVSFYRKSLAIEPHTETALRLGEAWMLLGNVHEARVAFAQSLELARVAGDSSGEMAAHTGLGDVGRATGDLMAAQSAYTTAMRIAEQQLACDPANSEWQRDLAIRHHQIGEVLVAQGHFTAALAAYRQSAKLAAALVARDPANTESQRDLSVTRDRIAKALEEQGDGAGALAAYRQSLEVLEALAARDPENTMWQRDLSISHNKIGDVLVTWDGPGALAAYRQSLAVREALTARDPENTRWQRDLSVSHIKIGNVLVAQGDGPGALAAYRQSLAVREALAARDPENTEWQRDLMVILVKLGDATADKTYAARALDVALGLQERGVLAPRDGWMIGDLRRRAGR